MTVNDFFTLFIYTEKSIFIMTNVISATGANICIFYTTDFSFGLCQEIGSFQAIWCLYFPLLLIWSTIRKTISYGTRILYRLSSLVHSFPSFSSLIVNHLLCTIVAELCSVPVILPLTSLTKIVYHDERDLGNWCKHMYFLHYRLFIWVVPGNW